MRFTFTATPQTITLQLRREVPIEVHVPDTSFEASAVLSPADALVGAGELLTAAAQFKDKD